MPGNLSEKALSESLKELMRHVNFSRITIDDICEKAGVSRRNFYRHFRDKYELLSWIYDEDFVRFSVHHDEWTIWDYYPAICRNLYSDRSFYLNAFSIDGQNSFRCRCTELLYPLLMHDFGDAFDSVEDSHFFIDRITNATFDSFVRWLSSEPCMPPDQYAAQGKEKTRKLAAGILKISEKPAAETK